MRKDCTKGFKQNSGRQCRLFKNNVVYLNRTRHTPYLLCLQLGIPTRKARPTFFCHKPRPEFARRRLWVSVSFRIALIDPRLKVFQCQVWPGHIPPLKTEPRIIYPGSRRFPKNPISLCYSNLSFRLHIHISFIFCNRLCVDPLSFFLLL